MNKLHPTAKDPILSFFPWICFSSFKTFHGNRQWDIFLLLVWQIPAQTPTLNVSHMSAEPKWCFLNYPKGVMGIFLVLTMSFIRGYVSSNQIHLLFGIFVQKMVKNTWKRAFKGLYWFGLAWLCLSNDPGEVLTSQNPKNCIKIAKTLTIKYHWNCLILAFSIAPFWTFWSIFFV